MTHFEYIVGFLSILMGLAIAELLSGIGRIFRERRTTTIYWVHVTWMLLLICICIISWWNVWTLHDKEIQTISEFVMILAPRLLYVVLAFVLSPPISHGQHFNLREYYYNQFRLAAILLAAAFMLTTFYRWVFGNEGLYHPQSLVRFIGVVLVIALSFTNNSRIHGITAALLCVLVAIGFTVTLR